MAHLENKMPTTVEGWEAEIMHRLALTSGVDPSSFGPNVKALIRLQAEQLNSFDATFKGQLALIDQVMSSVKTGPLNTECQCPNPNQTSDYGTCIQCGGDTPTDHGNGD